MEPSLKQTAALPASQTLQNAEGSETVARTLSDRNAARGIPAHEHSRGANGLLPCRASRRVLFKGYHGYEGSMFPSRAAMLCAMWVYATFFVLSGMWVLIVSVLVCVVCARTLPTATSRCGVPGQGVVGLFTSL